MREVLLVPLVLLVCLVDLDLRVPQDLQERKVHLYVFCSLTFLHFVNTSVFCPVFTN